VNEVLNRSKVKVLLSKMEGGNKSVMEALAAGTPCLVYEGLIGRRDLTERSGMYTSDAELPEKLLYMVENHHRFDARGCMLSRSGVERSTEVLNAALRRAATDQGEPWTRDIVPGLHRFAGLAYRSEEDARSVEAGWEILRRHVRSEERHASEASA
jgi:glycosyltransferase involved in cell wall biosynthesis